MITLYFIIISVLYVCIIAYSLYGLQKPSNTISDISEFPFCSVIIAARNEEKNISKIIDNLVKQQYPRDKFEILICNDHSDDTTAEIIQSYVSESINLSLFDLPNELQGKKQALEYVLQFAKGDLLLFTDADCDVSDKWITSYASEHSKKNGNFYFGIVKSTSEKNILQKVFSLDFWGIILVQSGFAKMNNSFSCNAANMAISRSFYLNFYNSNSNFSSGDDVFVLHNAKKNNKSKVYFLDNFESVVETSVPDTLHAFIKQRIRWASKASGYSDGTAIFVSFVIYLYNFTIVTLALFSLYTSYYFYDLLFLFVFKTICDIILFCVTLPRFGKQNLLFFVMPFEFIYSFYITIIPIFAILIPSTWKGRKIK